MLSSPPIVYARRGMDQDHMGMGKARQGQGFDSGMGKGNRGKEDGFGSRQNKTLTEAQEKEVLEYINENDPETYQELCELKEKHPHMYRNILCKKMRIVKQLNRMKEKDPEQYEILKAADELETAARKLTQDYKNATEEKEKKQVKTELTTALNKLFDLKQQKGAQNIEKLEEKLTKLKSHLEKRSAQKTAIVERRLNELIGKAEGLEW